jgi:hypothetical protein
MMLSFLKQSKNYENQRAFGAEEVEMFNTLMYAKKMITKENLRETLRQVGTRLERRLTIKLGTLMVIGFTTMATLLKFWIIH